MICILFVLIKRNYLVVNVNTISAPGFLSSLSHPSMAKDFRQYWEPLLCARNLRHLHEVIVIPALTRAGLYYKK